jgi:GxxExxY protein
VPELERIATVAVDCGFHIHKELGPGLLENAYEALLAEALKEEGLGVVRQQPVSVTFRGIRLPDAFRADIVVENSLIIEVKSVDRNAPVHAKQLLTYLRLMKQPLGLLMNFGCETFRDGVKRVVNSYNPFAP